MSNIIDIFNTLKPSLIKGATPKDLLHDIEATAWEYAYQKTTHQTYDKEFMSFYSKALKVLRGLRSKVNEL
jgi:hypothetical protein